MKRSQLIRRSFTYHWRAHAAITLGVIAGGAALTGALLVGDSMRASLRAHALDRLGYIDQAVVGPRFFREALADDLRFRAIAIAPVILLNGGVSHAATQARSNQVGIFGVDERFWALRATDQPSVEMPRGSKAILNQALADELHARVGDPIVLRLGKPQDVSVDTLLGRRDRTTTSARLTVVGIVPAAGLGAFDLNLQQQAPKNLYVPLDALQRVLDQAGMVNALFLETSATTPQLTEVLSHQTTLADFGLSLRVDEARGYVALESDAFLIAPALEAAARRAAEQMQCSVEPILAYLANKISSADRVIPYSTVAAVPPEGDSLSRMGAADGARVKLQPGEILLNDWTARELNIQPGAQVELEYYLTGAFGRVETSSNAFTLAGVVQLAGAAADPGFTPPYPGVTDVDRIAEWDPPFPVDLKRLRDQDETYWKEHKTTPKAFITGADGAQLWTAEHEQHGRCTSLRLWPAAGMSTGDLAERFGAALRSTLSPATAGWSVVDIRAQAVRASRGTTDFSGLFVGFSFFLIAAAIMLVALLFRLSAERRAREIGLLLALGFAPRSATRLLLAEAAGSAVIGAVLGLLVGVGYARWMLHGLRTWWSDAVNAPFLHFAGTAQSYAIGLGATLAVSLPALIWSVSNLRRQSANQLLAGATESVRSGGERRRQRAGVTAAIAFLIGVSLLAATYMTDAISAPLAFFGGGAALLVAGLAAAALLLRAPSAKPLAAASSPRTWTLLRLGLRNAPRHSGRSLLIVALIASATFVTTAIQAFRLAPADDISDPRGGVGGFALIAEASTPLPYDLNTPAGREALNLSPATQQILAQSTSMPFRLRGGDAASCLNLYAPSDPRVLGVPCAMRQRGGFTFGKTLAETKAEQANPWLLLERELPDGEIPVIGDEASVLWQLHSGLGKRYSITDQSGRPRHLKFVALLKGSVLQGELLIAEEQFTRIFPANSGHAYFLIETASADVEKLAGLLEADLESFALDVTGTKQRLADLYAVQNTYLSTFQMLGGLGALLGSVGLIAVMLRNVWERRREFALMQAVGFSQRALTWIVLVENAALILGGLAIGAAAALIAIAPRILEDPAAVAWAAMLLLLVGMPALGLGVAAAVLRLGMRAPLLPALRRE